MEFNAMQQYRSSSDRFSLPQQPSRNVTQIMYPPNGFPIPPQPNQAMLRPQPHLSYPAWHINGTATPKSFPLQRRNTVLGDVRSQPSDIPASRPLSMTAQTIRSLGLQDPRFLQQSSFDAGMWGQKPVTEFDIKCLEPDMSDLSQSLMSADEDTPIIDLRQYSGFEADNSHDAFRNSLSRRMSESSFSMSSNGPMAEVMEDFSASDISYISDCDWNNLEPAKTLLSPMASPRPPTQHEMLRSSSRSRASPIPHNNMRTSPYTMETNRNKRWSTGTYASTPAPARSLQFNNRYSFYGSPLNPQHSLPAMPDITTTFQPQTQNLLYTQPTLPSSTTTLFSSPDQQFPEAPRPLPSQGLFRLLQSNADRLTGCASHFADLSDPPDLYASLQDEPSSPPESDMNPSDPDIVPHEQDLRFTGDLYTPRWVRGHGNKREGWCGLCKPGRWLVLKNSAFWYDKSFTHGVSAATGNAFQGPQETRRTEGNLDVWEGLCSSCGDWIPLVSSKKKGTTWFRHAYKCHTHAKVKEGPKRRRETSSLRARATSISSNYGATTSNASASSTQCSSDTSAVDTPTNSSDIIKIEETKPTPMSTPQLSQTPLSTPHMGAIANMPAVMDEPPLDQQHDQFMEHTTMQPQLPGLTIDSNGVRTINPLDSFASMI